MKTLTTGSNGIVGTAKSRSLMLTNVLLICGILYFPLYFAGHILAGMQLEGYSHLDQQVSELSAIGSPARPLLTALEPLYLCLAIVFSIGVWRLAGKNRSLRIAALALAAFGLVGFFGWFAPMNPPGAERSATDIAHLIVTFVTVLSMALFVGFGSGVDGKWFRIYSILTILASLVAGAWSGSQASRIAEGLPTPGLGAIQRVSVYSPMLWLIVFAIILLNSQPKQTRV